MKFPWATYLLQSKSTLSDKIFTEEEEYRLGYSENPDFLRLKTRGTEPIQILVPSTLQLVTASLVLVCQDKQTKTLRYPAGYNFIVKN